MARHDAVARALPDTICGLQRGARTKRQQTLAAGVPGITFSWGCSSALIARVHGAGAIAGVQIGSAAGAERALDAGADFLICQGVEAGGHVQSTLGLMALLERTRTVVGDATPIVAAGGLATGADIAAVRARGAVAAMLGTRFVATRESAAHPVYCRALLDADVQDTARTLCFDGGWSGAVHRVLRNDTLEAWEAIVARVNAAKIPWVIEPTLRFEGEPGEQWTCFFKDPSGNNLEFKHMSNPEWLFAKYNVADG